VTGNAPHGRLLAIARRPAPYAPMEEIERGTITKAAGLDGDHKGRKFPRRQITVLTREAWDDALAELRSETGAPVRLPWTARRANLLIEGVRLPRAKGAVLRVGKVELETTSETNPCRRMEQAYPGLLKALHPDWRGGVTCRVLSDGDVAVGDPVEVVLAPPDQLPPRLP
jgi:MOSC domain-containing protein YiiM